MYSSSDSDIAGFPDAIARAPSIAPVAEKTQHEPHLCGRANMGMDIEC